MKGTLDRRRDPAELIISKIIPIETAVAELARGVVVRLHKGLHKDEDLERLLRLVRVRPGHLDLYLEIIGLEHVRRADLPRRGLARASATTTSSSPNWSTWSVRQRPPAGPKRGNRSA